MGLPLYQVDAFTDRAFAGNPAAVCLLDRERPAGWLQQVAAEMNLSETAFLLPRDGDGFVVSGVLKISATCSTSELVNRSSISPSCPRRRSEPLKLWILRGVVSVYVSSTGIPPFG